MEEITSHDKNKDIIYIYAYYTHTFLRVYIPRRYYLL